MFVSHALKIQGINQIIKTKFLTERDKVSRMKKQPIGWHLHNLFSLNSLFTRFNSVVGNIFV